MSMPSWSSLPVDIWKNVLRRLTNSERLRICSLVSQQLHRAAAAATDSLHFRPDDLSGFDHGARPWINKYGCYLTSLSISDGAPDGPSAFTLPELPCSSLQRLDLYSCCVQLGPSSSQPGLLHSCSGLTHLCLYSCVVLDEQQTPSALSAVPMLESLKVSDCFAGCSPQQPLQMPIDVWMHLTRLTALKLCSFGVASAEALQHLGCLKLLNSLTLQAELVLSPSTSPWLSCLTALTSLQLHFGTMDAAVLQPCGQLLELSIAAVDVSIPRLLDALGGLKQLQQLVLSSLTQVQWPPPSAAYAALTASNALRRLELIELPELPEGVWQFVFPSGHKLQQLQELRLRLGFDTAATLGSADVSRLVSCCPGLRQLELRVQLGAQLETLSQLKELTRLEVKPLTASSLQSLSVLTGLQSLHVAVQRYPAWRDLLLLTRLTRLERFGVTSGGVAVVWLSQADADVNSAEVPDVWLQLLQRCAEQDSSILPYVIRALTQKLAQQAQWLERLQQQQQQQQQQPSQETVQRRQLKQQLQQQQGHMQELQQQLCQERRHRQQLEQRLQQQAADVTAGGTEAAKLRADLEAVRQQLQALAQAVTGAAAPHST